ncbi:MAG: FHA domain-containing protein, partial [Chloroflexi bacterium]|nr:FHA domain-containing protein [Chloroflexota bacterium]
MVRDVVCPVCQTVNEITEDPVCIQCGQLLTRDIDQTLLDTTTVGLRQQIQAYLSEQRPQDQIDTGEIALHFIETNQTTTLNYTRPILLGRRKKYSPTDDIFIDLTDHNAYVLGLSREHARIQHINDEYVIEDLGSSNGTLLNGKPLEPKHQFSLNDGD